MDAQTQNEIGRLAAENIAVLRSRYPDMFDARSLEQFMDGAKRVGPLDDYKHFPQDAIDVVNALGARHGKLTVRAFLRFVLLHGVQRLAGSDQLAQLPERVARDQCRHLRRIAGDTDTDAEWLDLGHDLFQKEFGIVSLRLYAAGSQLVDPRCGIPRSTVWRGGWGKAPGVFAKLAGLGGFKPYFQIHTHKFNLDAFNEAGWEECYRCCADLYKRHPECKGMFGSSWFYDPALDQVSPRLAYLRKTPLEGGANLFFYETGGEAIANALSTSESRRKLHEEGKYTPASYTLVWGQDAQRAWAAAHPGSWAPA